LRDAGFTVVEERRDQPDVVALDFCEHTAATSGVPVLAWVDPGSVRAAIRWGARGFVAADLSAAALRRAVLTVAAGGVFFGPGLLDAAAETPASRLTEREGHVLGLLAAGKSIADLARHLGLAPKTVRNRLAALGGKLGVRGQAELAAYARREGLDTPFSIGSIDARSARHA
jgi:DNA-binding NarL/FixJ family response regulator